MIIRLLVVLFIMILMLFSFGIMDLMNNAGEIVYTYAFFYAFVIGAFITIGLCMGIIFRLRQSGAWYYFDKPKKNKPLLEFLYRDGGKRPILGERIPGMGLFKVFSLGIVLDIGRLPSPGSVYFHGDKPVRYVLQDINHTPNPKFTGFYSFLTDIGFNTSQELQEVINGFNPELMIKVWNRLVDYKPQTAGDKIVERIKEMDEKDKKAFDREWTKELKQNNKNGMRKKIDSLIAKVKK